MGTSAVGVAGRRKAAAMGPARLAMPLALAGIAMVTVGWWAAALWPLPAATPEWVVRARAACFGSTDSGLPNSGGWILLVGTPLTMVAALVVIAREELRASMREVRRSAAGRWALGLSIATLVVLAALAAGRVASASGYGFGYGTGYPWDSGSGRGGALPAPLAAADLPRSDAAAPHLELIDQHGSTVRLEDFLGRPVLLTFAYGQCATICPVIVHNALRARDEVADMDPVLLVITLDPWRDTPTRLPHIAASWGLSGDARLLGGSVERVESTLDAWAVQRTRDRRTGEIEHASVVHVMDRQGRVAFTATGSAAQIAGALRRLDQDR
jgi:cytochrome oxidase Cu insertion factor (SCO1/SenC/PrrC family)